MTVEGVSFVAQTANENAQDCIVCNREGASTPVRSGPKLIGYRHGSCAIPDYMKAKYPNIR